VREGARNQARSIARMSHLAAWLAWSVCGLAVVLIACAVALAFLNRSDVRVVIFHLGVRFLPLYFPNGRLVSRRLRWVVRVALVS
jgi:hypothetical protein